MDSIGEGKEHVDTAAQDLKLELGLAMECDEARFDRAFRRPHLLHDSDLIVRDVAKDIGDAQENENYDDDRRPDAGSHKAAWVQWSLRGTTNPTGAVTAVSS